MEKLKSNWWHCMEDELQLIYLDPGLDVKVQQKAEPKGIIIIFSPCLLYGDNCSLVLPA